MIWVSDLSPEEERQSEELEKGYFDALQNRSLAKLPYREYLRTEHWQRTRRRALFRAGFQCKRCEAAQTQLDVHHLTYDRLGWENEQDLVVLCRQCHAKEHTSDPELEAALDAVAERTNWTQAELLYHYGPDMVKRWAREAKARANA